MAKIDLKNATIKIWDGTLGTLLTDCTAALSDITWTAVSKHMGSRLISIEFDATGADESLAIAVTGTAIVVTLETISSVVQTTAADLVAAIALNAAAAALVTGVEEGVGSGILETKAAANLSQGNSISITIGEGTLSYSEKTPREFVKDRGNLDTVRNADQEPMDVSFDFIWDFITAESGGTATVEEALRREGEAAAWVTSATDTCQPYSVGLEIINAPSCSSVNDEYTMFEEFYQENLDHDAKEGTVACSGRCNKTAASHYRVA